MPAALTGCPTVASSPSSPPAENLWNGGCCFPGHLDPALHLPSSLLPVLSRSPSVHPSLLPVSPAPHPLPPCACLSVAPRHCPFLRWGPPPSLLSTSSPQQAPSDEVGCTAQLLDPELGEPMGGREDRVGGLSTILSWLRKITFLLGPLFPSPGGAPPAGFLEQS